MAARDGYQLRPTTLVLRRPHFRRVGDEFYFLISRRPLVRLPAVELAVWDSLNDTSSVDELRSRFPETADRAIVKLVDLGLCGLAESGHGAGRRRIIVFEPHSDDAVLSVGGTMWSLRHECQFVVVTFGSRSNYTSYWESGREFFDVEQITALRNAEGALFARSLGGEYRALGQLDAPLRYQDGAWSLDWYRSNRPSIQAFIGHRSGEDELQEWTDAALAVLGTVQADEVWIPLGGPHTDHRLARDACLKALFEDGAPKLDLPVRFYQEVPYAVILAEYTPLTVEALLQTGVTLHPEAVPIGSVFVEKMRLIALYGSQFKAEALRAQVEACARLAGRGARLAEQFWRLEQPTQALGSLRWIASDPYDRAMLDRLSPWLQRHRRARRVRILLMGPAGRWVEDMGFLLDRFPEMLFEVHVSPEDPEVARRDWRRVRVRLARGGVHRWKLLGLRLLLARPLPTLILACGEPIPLARRLARLCPLCDPVVLATMDQLVFCLQHLQRNDGIRPVAPRERFLNRRF